MQKGFAAAKFQIVMPQTWDFFLIFDGIVIDRFLILNTLGLQLCQPHKFQEYVRRCASSC